MTLSWNVLTMAGGFPLLAMHSYFPLSLHKTVIVIILSLLFSGAIYIFKRQGLKFTTTKNMTISEREIV
jgi:hypothetical protein